MAVFQGVYMRLLLFLPKPWQPVCRLIYSGQEEPVLRPLQFFEKDPIEFGKFGRAKFYKTLLNLRKSNPALVSKCLISENNCR